MVLFLPSAMSQVTWDGGAGTNNWLDGLNWSTDAIPVSGNGAISITTGAGVVLSGNAGSPNSGFTLSGNSSLEVETGGLLTISDPVINAGSVLMVTGGTLNYRRLGNSAGKIMISGGRFSSSAINESTGQLAEAEISGGTWAINSLTTFGRTTSTKISVSGGAIVASGSLVMGYLTHTNSTTIDLTGGSISAGAIEQRLGMLHVSGGGFSTTGDYNWFGADTGTNKVLRVSGGAGTLSVGGNFTASGSTGIREFVLTARNSGVVQENISTLVISGTDSAGGNVDVGLQGGILLGNPTTYTLIQSGTMTGSIIYTGSNLYDGAVVGNNYQITLDAGANQGGIALVALETPVSEAFSLAGVGYIDVDLTTVMGDNPSLLVRLDADAGSSTLSNMVAYLSQSGYSNVALDAFGDYDISFTIDNAFLSDATMYLGWDFTEFASGAGLSGIQISAVPEPGVVWLVGAVGVSFLLWRRRRH